jgi:hypothetical protein
VYLQGMMHRGEIAMQDQEKGGNPLDLSLDDMAISSAKEHQTRRRRPSLKHLDHLGELLLLLGFLPSSQTSRGCACGLGVSIFSLARLLAVTLC